VNAKGKLATIDVLGEDVTNPDEARAIAGQYDDVLARIDGSAAFRDEVCQRLREKLFVSTPARRAKIFEYSGKGSLASWLRTVALRELQEHLIRLYAAGRRVVILIDEAHVMPEDTLEQVRVPADGLANRLAARLAEPWRSPKLG